MIRAITPWGRHAHILVLGRAHWAVLLGPVLRPRTDACATSRGQRDPAGAVSGAAVCGQQGCVFVRAGVDGRRYWVPRVNAAAQGAVRLSADALPRGRRGRAAPPKAVEPVAAPAPAVTGAARSHAKPARVAAADDAAQEAGQRLRRRAARRQRAGHVALPSPRADCRTGSARIGGTVILCVSRAGLVGAATLPDVARRVATATGDNRDSGGRAPVADGQRPRHWRLTLTEPDDGIDLVKPVVPKGYKLAWKDDRLNARRAQGTAGRAGAQDLVWTRETPARLVTRAERAQAARSRARRSPVDQGCARQAALCAGRQLWRSLRMRRRPRRRLRGSDCRSRKRAPRSGGRQLQVVLAGPFASRPTQARRSARAAARRISGCRS